jgi:hypothetical protein
MNQIGHGISPFEYYLTSSSSVVTLNTQRVTTLYGTNTAQFLYYINAY